MNNRDRVLSYLASFGTGNPDIIVGHVTEDFDNRQISDLGEGCRGRETYRQRLAAFLTDFKELNYVPEDVITEGDRVAVTYKMNCRCAGKLITMVGVMVMTLEDGLIASRADYWDGTSFLRQVGQAPTNSRA